MEMQAVEAQARARVQAADVLVCGHGHRYRDRRLEDGLRWLVLDAWGGAHDTLTVDDAGDLALQSTGRPD